MIMDPVNLVAGYQQMLGFTPTTSLVGSGEKLGTDPRIGQSACCGLCREPFFSGTVALLNYVGDYAKGCHVRGAYAGHTWTGAGNVHVMLVGFSPAGCTSIRIAVTLRYE
jgi:hypothetical protein